MEGPSFNSSLLTNIINCTGYNPGQQEKTRDSTRYLLQFTVVPSNKQNSVRRTVVRLVIRLHSYNYECSSRDGSELALHRK